MSSMDRIYIDYRSVAKGLLCVSTRHLYDPWRFWRSRDGVFVWTAFGVNHFIGFANTGMAFGIHIWTPAWHKGRGPYVTGSIGTFRFGRGY